MFSLASHKFLLRAKRSVINGEFLDMLRCYLFRYIVEWGSRGGKDFCLTISSLSSPFKEYILLGGATHESRAVISMLSSVWNNKSGSPLFNPGENPMANQPTLSVCLPILEYSRFVKLCWEIATYYEARFPGLYTVLHKEKLCLIQEFLGLDHSWIFCMIFKEKDIISCTFTSSWLMLYLF